MSDQLDISKNTGVLQPQFSPTDFIAGATSPILFEERLPTGDWTNFKPSEEGQASVYFDTFACVTFSALNSIETQLNWYIAQGSLSQEFLKFLKENNFFDSNGKVNFSDRFTAKMSGTTPQGNYAQKVWDSIRHDGLVPESLWSYPREQRQPPFTRDEYYMEIPQGIKDFGLKILDFIDISYEFVVLSDFGPADTATIKQHLKHAPLQFLGPTCPPWNTDQVIEPCGKTQPSHATLNLMVQSNSGVLNIFDQYNPYQKQLAATYCVPFVVKGVVNLRKTLPVVDPLTYRYGQSRTWTSFLAEQANSLKLRTGMQEYKLTFDPKWYMIYVVALTYGGYSVTECLKNIKYGHVVHPTIVATTWRTTQDYLTYYSKPL